MYKALATRNYAQFKTWKTWQVHQVYSTTPSLHSTMLSVNVPWYLGKMRSTGINVGYNAPPNPVPCCNWYLPRTKMYTCFIHYQLYNICNILLKYIIVSQRTVSVHYILPNLWQKPAAEFPKKIIHLKVWSTIHVLSFNPKFDLNPRLTHIPKQGIMCWELSFSTRKSYLIFVVK